MKVVHEDRPDLVKLTPTLQALLAFLLLNRHRSHPREFLSSLFWGDQSPEKARGCLNTALWRLRLSLEPDFVPNGAYLLTHPTGEVGFNRESPYWLDVAVFDEQVRDTLSKPWNATRDIDADKIEAVLSLYQGDLLEGFYEDWALRERERLRLQYLNCLEYLMAYYKRRQDYNKSIALGQKILALDPLHEEIHREMMRLYLENGQRAFAVRQYQICQEHLAAELNIPPMEETENLYRQILSESGSSQGAALPNTPMDLRQAIRELNLAKQKIQKAMLYIERLVEEDD